MHCLVFHLWMWSVHGQWIPISMATYPVLASPRSIPSLFVYIRNQMWSFHLQLCCSPKMALEVAHQGTDEFPLGWWTARCHITILPVCLLYELVWELLLRVIKILSWEMINHQASLVPDWVGRVLTCMDTCFPRPTAEFWMIPVRVLQGNKGYWNINLVQGFSTSSHGPDPGISPYNSACGAP